MFKVLLRGAGHRGSFEGQGTRLSEHFKSRVLLSFRKKIMAEQPITTVSNGRFQPGNQAAVGHSSRSQKLRCVMLEAITEDDVRADVKAVVGKLVALAKGGDVAAIKLLFDRVLGKVVAIEEPPVGWTPEQRAAKTAEIAERIRRLRLA